MEKIENYKKHVSVLFEECIQGILENKNDDSQEWIADLTFGGGGHSFGFCEQNPFIKILALDQDLDAINNGSKIIADKNYQDRIFLHHDNFKNIEQIIDKNYPHLLKPAKQFLGVLMDLGVSSHHFDQGERGFSFMNDGDLDMRMNQADEESISARDVINEYSEVDLADIIYKYGEEGFSRVIARNIVEKRKEAKIQTTKELENIIFHSYPSKLRKGRTHPATRTFQALRLYVNQELEVLEKTLLIAATLLKPKGRLAVISFHSLEDRIVKHEFRRIEKDRPEFKVITKKPIVPKSEEIKRNFRSRSAKLRILEHI